MYIYIKQATRGMCRNWQLQQVIPCEFFACWSSELIEFTMSSTWRCSLVVFLGLALMLASLALSSALDCDDFDGPSGGITIHVYLSKFDKYMDFAADDKGSGARRDLTVFKPKTGYWFGHSAVEGYGPVPTRAYKVVYNGDIHAPRSPIAKPVGWNRIWGLRRCSDRSRVYGLWCPIAPIGYVALGCIFRQTDCGANQADSSPPDSEVSNLVTLRADLAAPAISSGTVWNDRRSGARDDGSVYTLEKDDGAGCGTDLGLMLAQAGYDDYGNAGAFGVPNYSTMTVRLHT